MSILGFCDGKTVRLAPAAQDHKRIYEFDQGLNTGGMGAFAPSPAVTPPIQQAVITEVMQRAIDGCRADGHPFIGVLFAGLMLTREGPQCLEFNVRFGDPETQVILPSSTATSSSSCWPALRGGWEHRHGMETQHLRCLCGGSQCRLP